jgi:hypothetical protein
MKGKGAVVLVVGTLLNEDTDIAEIRSLAV